MTDRALKLKIPPGELWRLRSVRERRHRLSDLQKTELMKMPIKVFLSASFLSKVGVGLNRTERQIYNSGGRATAALSAAGIETVEDVLREPYDKLALADGMGTHALALLLDVLCLFGFEVNDVVPEPARHSIDIEHQAKTWAQALGIGA